MEFPASSAPLSVASSAWRFPRGSDASGCSRRNKGVCVACWVLAALLVVSGQPRLGAAAMTIGIAALIVSLPVRVRADHRVRRMPGRFTFLGLIVASALATAAMVAVFIFFVSSTELGGTRWFFASIAALGLIGAAFMTFVFGAAWLSGSAPKASVAGSAPHNSRRPTFGGTIWWPTPMRRLK